MKSVEDEWLELETATEIIGQLIAYHVATTAQGQLNETLEREETIRGLGQEQNACYRSATSEAMIQKAFTEYGPFLTRLEFSKKGRF